MDRLTERFSNGQAAVYGCGNNCKYDYKYCHNHYEDCPTINEIYEKLARYEDTGFEPGEIEKMRKSYSLDVGQEVYVLTRYYSSSPYEIIKCRINRKTVKTRQTFSVSGRYSNGNFYNGTFVEKSIGKTVFILEEDAIRMRDKLNSKRF